MAELTRRGFLQAGVAGILAATALPAMAKHR
jgi:hypothetical protein